MSTLKTISSALTLIDTKKQNLKTAFENLQSHHSLPLSWPQIDSHFTSLQNSLINRFNTLQSLEQSQSQSKTLTNEESSSSRNELRVFIEKIDGVGLRNYIMENYKDMNSVQVELIEEFRCAQDAGEIVLQSLEGFFGVNGCFYGKSLRRMRRICNMLMRILSVSGVNLSSRVKEKALKVALEWKGKLGHDCGNIVGALGFLYLVYAFGIVSEFSMDELVEFAAMAAVNGEFMKLCRDIGMTDRVPEIVQKLVDRGKHVLAVKYIFEFNLAHKIPPVPILKAGVEEAKQLARRLSEEGKPRMEIINREIHALKSVIAGIENHKLGSEYPRASLDQRVEQLKGQKENMEDRTPASILNQPTLQQQKRKRSMKQQQQQQNETKLPRTSTSFAPAAVLKNAIDDNSVAEQLKGQKENMEDRTPASILNQPPLQQQQRKRSMKQKQQQNEIKLPRTSTSFAPAAVIKNGTNDNSTKCHFQQPLLNPPGLFLEHPNPYMNLPVMPPGMVGPTLTRPSYRGPSAGTYGLAGIPIGPSGNPNLGGSHIMNSLEPHGPSAYYDSNLWWH